jgi:hypothetical protein
VVGGDKLGDAFWAITVSNVSALGCEKLPRPFGDFQTVEDVVGHCIAWPSTHVSFSYILLRFLSSRWHCLFETELLYNMKITTTILQVKRVKDDSN